MKYLLNILLFMGIIAPFEGSATNYWTFADAGKLPQKLQVMHPDHFMVYTLDEAALKIRMCNLSEDPNDGMIISLPLPDGAFRDFKVWQTPMMPASLAAKYPQLKTFTAEAVGNHAVTAKLDFTGYGFHAMIFDGENTSFVDPYDNYHNGFYMVHYKRDEVRAYNDLMHCEVKNDQPEHAGGEPMSTSETGLPALAKVINGYSSRTYRIAVSCSHQYAQAATGSSTPSIADVFAKMLTTMNRVNGVYNRELSVQMNFVANEDTLIWPTNTGSVNGNDTFNAWNSNGPACLNVNQVVVTQRIGTANFDCGHVFTTGGGGISNLGVVCTSNSKAKSCTGSPTPVGDGYDIDYVAHEMGHEFGSQHTFNDNANGSCSPNAVSSCAYEPGSGATIMDYAGICSPDDLQMHSDAYFNISSLTQIEGKLEGSENACAVIASTGNLSVALDPYSANYIIPYKTPFEITGPTAVDSVADTAITYGWAQWNRGDFGKTLAATHIKGPIFRSFNPVYNPTRVFPSLNLVLGGVLTNATSEGHLGEKVPDTARYLTFKMAVRNILNGYGCFLAPDDTVHIDAVSTGASNDFGGFKVTSQGTTGISYIGGTTQTITWNVVGSDAAPVSAATVDIYMSTDGGNTWPYLIGNFPNNGSADIAVPNPPSTTASGRFKVKGSGNIFFNVNLKNFTVANDPGLPSASVQQPSAPLTNLISIYPVPANNILHIASKNVNRLHATLFNAIGQIVWSGQITAATDVSVSTWAKGVYYARFRDAANDNMAVKSFVID